MFKWWSFDGDDDDDDDGDDGDDDGGGGDQFVKGVAAWTLTTWIHSGAGERRLGAQKYGIGNTENMESLVREICKCDRDGSNCAVSPATW